MSIPTLLANNAAYVHAHPTPSSTWTGDITAEVLVLTCIDPRVNVEEALGLSRGGVRASVLRNGAGYFLPKEIGRDLVIVQLLVQVSEIMVVHHTGKEQRSGQKRGRVLMRRWVDCGALRVAGETLVSPKAPAPEWFPSAGFGEGAVAAAAECGLHVVGFPREEGWSLDKVLVESIRHDVAELKKWGLLRPSVGVSGYVYETETGRVVPVEEWAAERKVV